jgi:hypothetical protein
VTLCHLVNVDKITDFDKLVLKHNFSLRTKSPAAKVIVVLL